MRFDDSLETVLAADMSSEFGAQSGWRQLVDLIGRGRAPADVAAIERLRAIRAVVPAAVRGASARALAFARPPAALVALFADDDLAIAAPVLRIAQLSADEWGQILPAMSSANRSVLRHRRDLAPSVSRALDSFGPVDFILPAGDGASAAQMTPPANTLMLPVLPSTALPAPSPDQPAMKVDAEAEAKPFWPDSSFVSLASVASGLPVVVESMRLQENVADGLCDESDMATPAAPADEAETPQGPFQIADLVARIEAFRRRRDDEAGGMPAASPILAPLHQEEPTPPVASFPFETDASGVIRWVSGVPRSAVIGTTIATIGTTIGATNGATNGAIIGSALGAGAQGGTRVDGSVAGAFRRRSSFTDGRLRIDGQSSVAGAWQISGVPAFDPASGRFSGYRGWARRPRIDERAEPIARGRSAATDSLRQLVHELRTPTTAITGFAEMIEGQMLGPVASPYRDYASTIKQSATALLGAIDDLDTAARIEAHALDLRPTQVPLVPLLDRIAADLAPLIALRRAALVIEATPEMAVRGDDRAVDRLLARLIAALMASASAGESIKLRVSATEDIVVIDLDRPHALAAHPGDALLAIDAEREAEQGAPLLGTGFALRLARNLATELGGSLTIGAECLTLRLPAALSLDVGHVSTN